MTLRPLALAFGALLLGTVAVQAQGAKQDFELVNETGYDIKHVYVAPNTSDDWEEDVLGKEELEDGDTWTIKFNPKVQTCKWDLKVVYTEDDSSAYWRNIDLCKVSKITIKYDKKNDTTSASFE